MQFEINGVKRATGESISLEINASDERAAGWVAIEKGIEVLSITPLRSNATTPARQTATVEKAKSPASRRVGRILLIAGLILFIATGVFLVPAEINYYEIDAKVQRLHRLSGAPREEIAHEYPVNGRAGLFGDLGELHLIEQQQQDCQSAVYQLRGEMVLWSLLIVVALGMMGNSRKRNLTA